MVGKVAGPKDPCKMVQAIFFWLGIGTLLPWNMFITVGLSPPPLQAPFGLKESCVISSDPPDKDGNVRFPMVPLKTDK